jgi:hypothetical protein
MRPVPAAPLVIALLVTAATVTGAVALALGPAPWSPSSGLLMAAGMALATVIAVAGILLARGRWAGRLGAVLAVTWIATGGLLDSRFGIAVVLLAAVSLTATSGPWLGRWLRRLPTVGGVPAAAVVVLLTLVLTPAALALAGPEGVAAGTWGFAAWSWLLALLLGRAVPGSLLLMRWVHPIAAAAGAIAVRFPVAAVPVASAVIVVVLAWRRDLALALAPVVPASGGVLRLPPELAPLEVLEAAGADESGRRKEPA